jgi:hypothetical protein
MDIRKLVTSIEEIHAEAGHTVDPPLRRVAVAAVCANPCAGRYVEDLAALIEGSVHVGRRIAGLAAQLMEPQRIECYGKGAIVGIHGEAEHAEAVLTTPFGDTLRAAAGGGKAWICHMAKRGLPGTPIDIPTAHKDALTIRSHYDAMTITLPDAPQPDEIVIIAVFANRGRPNHRIGGHSVARMIGEDGLR